MARRDRDEVVAAFEAAQAAIAPVYTMTELLADAGRPVAPEGSLESAFYLRLAVADQPGVLARVAVEPVFAAGEEKVQLTHAVGLARGYTYALSAASAASGSVAAPSLPPTAPRMRANCIFTNTTTPANPAAMAPPIIPALVPSR